MKCLSVLNSFTVKKFKENTIVYIIQTVSIPSFFLILFFLILFSLIYLFKEFPLPPLLPIPSRSPYSISSYLTIPKSSQGFLPCGKSKFLPPPSRSRKVSIQTDQDPKQTVHTDETRPSVIVNGFSVSPPCQPHSENPV